MTIDIINVEKIVSVISYYNFNAIVNENKGIIHIFHTVLIILF